MKDLGLDKARTAVLAMDFQEGIVSMNTKSDKRRLSTLSLRSARGCRKPIMWASYTEISNLKT